MNNKNAHLRWRKKKSMKRKFWMVIVFYLSQLAVSWNSAGGWSWRSFNLYIYCQILWKLKILQEEIIEKKREREMNQMKKKKNSNRKRCRQKWVKAKNMRRTEMKHTCQQSVRDILRKLKDVGWSNAIIYTTALGWKKNNILFISIHFHQSQYNKNIC